MALVDLSLLIAEDLPCHWVTHLPFQHKTWNWFTERHDPSGSVHSKIGSYATRWMAIDEHTGTHLDAPTHFIPPPDSGLPNAGPAGSVSAERVPLRQHMGPAAVIDVTGLTGGAAAGESPIVGAAVVGRWEAEHGPLQAGDVCLLRTGWDSRYRRGQAGQGYLHDVVVSRQQPGWPAPDAETIELLLNRGVACLGTDAPTIGPAHGDLSQAVHIRGLSSGMVFIEGLARLDMLPARGAWFCFLPLNVEGATGAPGRAIAWVPAGVPGSSP